MVLARKLHSDTTLTIDEICETLRISRSTYYRYVAESGNGSNS
ncbi:MAG: hypothetical protein H8E44_26175 [Planctomycetes bacterium]|nr:hypothetical protein [Planctomycetota bacterium]MBL7044251.1 hypothetical protein [Pirellulaceae bacterium]